MSDEYAERLRRVAGAIFDQPVIQNNYRSAYVEVLVADLLGDPWKHVGANWSAWDIAGPGDAKLEVKQSAAKQTWHVQPRSRKPYPEFDIAERKGYFDERSQWIAKPGRFADIYVFAWHPVEGPECDHRDPRQWLFYVTPVNALPVQGKIRLSKIQSLASETTAQTLRMAVERVLEGCASAPNEIPPVL